MMTFSSCQKEDVVEIYNEPFTLRLTTDQSYDDNEPQPMGAATRSDVSNIDNFVAQAFSDDTYTTPANIFADGTESSATSTTGEFAVKLDRTKDYYLLLWADEGDDIYNTDDLKSVTLNQNKAVSEVFAGKLTIEKGSDVPATVSLKRAVAKISMRNTLAIEAGKSIEVSYMYYKQYNVATSLFLGEMTNNTTTLTTTAAAAGEEFAFVWVLASADEQTLTFTYNYEEQGNNTVENVPYQANRRTNLTGEYAPPPTDLVYNTTTSTYEIHTPNGMRAFADLVNGAENSTGAIVVDAAHNFETLNLDIKGKLMGNIDLEGDEDNQWTAIGIYASKFTGTFDGNSYKISGLYINKDSNYQGLFGCLGNGAIIQNLGVAGTVIAEDFVGGIVGRNAGIASSIIGCYSEVTVKGIDDVGGIVGYNSEDLTITDCYNTGSVALTGSYGNSVGGIVGGNYNNAITLTACYNTGNVTAIESAMIGGIVGVNNSGATTLIACYNTGSISSTGANDDIGGIVGSNYFNNGGTITITACYNTGSLTTTGSNGEIGGILGVNAYNSEAINVSACYFLSGKGATAGIGTGGYTGDIPFVETIQVLNNQVVTMNSAIDNSVGYLYEVGANQNKDVPTVVPKEVINN